MATKALSELSLASPSSSEDGDILDVKDDEGWEDMEPDLEKIKVSCLLGDADFSDVQTMLQHCRDAHDIDISKIQKTLRLEFLDMIKLVNYVRSQVKAGVKSPDVTAKLAFQDDQYLLPVLEDDAVLYSLHDVIGEDFDDDKPQELTEIYDTEVTPGSSDVARIKDLERDLQRAQKELEATRKILESRQQVLQTYQDSVLAAEDDMGEEGSDLQDSKDPRSGTRPDKVAAASNDNDSSYFAAYATHDIHEIMLKDTVRTDAYRDFIYENKHLFEGKTILDVGCGTGILSMFCARAGAAKVIAVDNSDIINFARENIFKNGMGEIISCLRGKIEEVTLPVKNVDIIISEWMGYCLLYEAMLDSVIWARDRYLSEDGLMIPSHCTLRIAPMTDPDYIDEHIHSWRHVYGFDMNSMQEDLFKEVVVRDVKSAACPTDSTQFLRLSMHAAQTEDLSFDKKPFYVGLQGDMGVLDGFVVWFDTFFLTSRYGEIPLDIKAEDCERRGGESIAFTTGPHGPRTHWQQAVLLIDHGEREPETVEAGQILSGSIGYVKRQDDSRALDINVCWKVDDTTENGKQTWSMR